jgi:hypothetical protein
MERETGVQYRHVNCLFFGMKVAEDENALVRTEVYLGNLHARVFYAAPQVVNPLRSICFLRIVLFGAANVRAGNSLAVTSWENVLRP